MVFYQLPDWGLVVLDLECSTILLGFQNYAEIPLVQAKSGRQQNCQDQSQPNQGPRADGTPCISLLRCITTKPHMCIIEIRDGNGKMNQLTDLFGLGNRRSVDLVIGVSAPEVHVAASRRLLDRHLRRCWVKICLK